MSDRMSGDFAARIRERLTGLYGACGLCGLPLSNIGGVGHCPCCAPSLWTYVKKGDGPCPHWDGKAGV